MVELVPKDDLLAAFSVPFAIEGATTFGWRLSVRLLAPIPWIPKELSKEPVSDAILRFSDGAKLIIATRSGKPLNETNILHFESREHSDEQDAARSVDAFRRKLVLLDAINQLGIQIVPSEDEIVGPLESERHHDADSKIDQLSGGAGDSFRFPESVGVKGICADMRLKEPEINTTSLHSALNALIEQRVDVDDKFSPAVDLLRSAGREASLRAKFLLTFGALEAVCTVQDRTQAERALIGRLLDTIQDANLSSEKKASLRSAVGNLKKQPLREAMLERVHSASSRSQIDKEEAGGLINVAVKVRNSIAHPSHPRLPEDLAEITARLHLLVLRLVLSESNPHAYTIPTVSREQKFDLSGMALVFPLNASRIWYLSRVA